MVDRILQDLPDALTNPIVVLVLCAVVAILLLTLWLARPIDAIPAFASPNGDVAIARKALQSLVENRCLAFKSVGHAHADVRRRSDKIDLLVEIRVRPELRLEDLAEQIQTEVAVLLKDNLGLKNVGDIDVLVVGLHRD